MIYRFFVAGTDTGVGKTLISSALLCKAGQQGYATFGLKPVAAGCIGEPPTNRDALLLQRHSSVQLDYDWHNPVALRAAIAPHIAAEQEGCAQSLQLPSLTERCENSLTKALETHSEPGIDSWQLVEGAGGWMVPLNHQHTLADLALSLGTPVILVVGIRLGCINHALLSIQAIQSRGLKIAGWVANSLSPDMEAEKNNLEFLTQAMQNARVPLLGRVPYNPDLDIEESDTEHFLPTPADIERVAEFLTLPN